MARSTHRKDWPLDFRVPLLEDEVEKLEGLFERVDSRMDEIEKVVSRKLNGILVSIVGLALTILGAVAASRIGG